MANTYTVQRPRVMENGGITMEPHKLDAQIWNSAYNFTDVIKGLSPSDRRLVDPIYLIFQASLEFLLQHFDQFTVNHLATICTYHGIFHKGQRKDVIIQRMRTHLCGVSCDSLLYVFKVTNRPRPIKPWNHTRTLIPLTRLSQQASKAIPNTATRTNSQFAVQTFNRMAADIGSLSNWDNSRALRAALSRPSNVHTQSKLIEGHGATRIIQIPPVPAHLSQRECAHTPDPRNHSTTIPEHKWQHLRPSTDSDRRSIIQEWQRTFSLDHFLRKPCAVCSTLVFLKEIQTAQACDIDLTLLRNDDLPTATIPTTYNYEAYSRAILDPQGLEDIRHPRSISICKSCLKDLNRGLMPRFALCNWLYYAREELPSDVRSAFQAMSVFEKALICRARTNSILCRFRGFDHESSEVIFSARRRHIKGNIISTPLDTVRINDILPPSSSSIGDTLCALMISATPPTRSTLDKLHPILVRKSRIRLLLDFLIRNNPHYQKSESFRGFSSSHLDNLFDGPSDIGIPRSVRIGHLPINDAIDAAMADYSGRLDEVDGLIMENVSYTLGDRSAFSYREMRLHALQHCKEGKPFLSSRSGTQPLPDINNPNWLSWAHPNADPFGIGGFHHPRRKRPIGMEQQLRHLLTVRDPFFENDPELSFDIYNIIRKGSVNTSLRFCIPYTAYANIVQDIVHMNRNDLTELRQKYRRDPNYQPKTTDERRIIRTMTSISPVARRIPGSVAQKIKMRNEIRAVISQRGSPSLFVTLNPADYYNPIVTVLASRSATHADLEKIESLTLKDRTTAALNHPVACARFFDLTVKNFIHVILRYGRKGKKGIFGVCDSYYGTVETQGRGSLHCHMLIWLQGHLPPESLASTLKASEQYRKRLIGWLDSIVSSGFLGHRQNFNTLPSYLRDEIGMSERHPATMVGPEICKTEPIQFQREMNEYLDELLLRFNWHVHTGTCWKYLRPKDTRSPENCRFGMDGTSRPQTEIDLETGAINIRRLHPRMTHFNPLITFLIKCNTDIKFIGSGEDAKAFMYYVTDYITKAPLSMHAGLTALSYAIKQGEARGVLSEDNRCESDNRRAMTIAVNSMLGHQEISHPQVMSYIMGGGERYTSESFQPINWAEVLRYIESSLKLQESMENRDGACTTGQAMNDVNVSVSVEQGKMNASNQLIDYLFRPTTDPFATMGLYTFVTATKKVSKTHKSHAQPQNDGRFTSSQHPQYHTHALSLRAAPVVPVLLGPRIPRRNGSEAERDRWARDMCILFKPWRVPTDLVMEPHDWYARLQGLIPLLGDKDRQIIENMSLLAEAKHARDARPRRPKQIVTHDRDQINVDSLIDVAVQEENHPTEHSIFGFVQSADEEGRNIQGPEIPGRLTSLIGDEAATAFNTYLRIHDTLTGDDDSTRDPVRVGESYDDDMTEQAIFMGQWKRTKPKVSAEEGEEGAATAPIRPVGEAPPSAAIQRIMDDFWHSKRSRVQQWRVVKRLMSEKGIDGNAEQRRAFEVVAHHVIEGGDQLLMYVGGRGGTGKSYLIETMVELFRILSRADELRVGAPTGIAASLIGGTTLHSLFSVGANYRKSGKDATNERLVKEWSTVKYLIVDETSMLSAQFLAVMSARLRMAKGDLIEESTKIFGGVNIIFTGDLYQLAPPKQPSLFAHRLVNDPNFLQTRDNSGLDSIAGAYLWRRVHIAVLLQKNRRHAKDPVLAELLDRVRNNTCLDKDGRPISFAGASALEHLRRREVSYVASRDPTELEAFQDAPVIVGSKPLRDTLNACLLIAHARRMGRSVHIYHSRDFVHREKTSGTTEGRLWDLPSRVTGESFGRLPLFIGMRVMVTENVSIPYKVVNGKEGIVEDIKYSTDDSGRRFAEAVHVRIDKCTMKAPGLDMGVVPLFATATSIEHVTQRGNTMAKSFRRKQVPLVPAYSYTDYKLQGRTLPRAIIDLTSSRGQGIYVMLSRVVSLRGLLILRWFPDSKILQRMSGELRDEIKRLEAIDAQTQQLYDDHVLAPSPLRRRPRTTRSTANSSSPVTRPR